MSLPILNASEPTVVPSKTFDKWWIKEINIIAPDPNGDAHAHVVLAKFRTKDDGLAELSSETNDLNIMNILSSSQNDGELASIINYLMTYIARVGIEQGIIKSPQ